jgi:hypothetical protein
MRDTAQLPPCLLCPFNFELAHLRRVGIGMIVTDAEFCLRTARALLPIRPELAASFVNRVGQCNCRSTASQSRRADSINNQAERF